MKDELDVNEANLLVISNQAGASDRVIMDGVLGKAIDGFVFAKLMLYNFKMV